MNTLTRDQVVVGDFLPRYNGHFGISAEINNIGFYVSMNYRLGGQIYNQTLVDKVENANIKYNVDAPGSTPTGGNSLATLPCTKQ
jgi:hypothetical protein